MAGHRTQRIPAPRSPGRQQEPLLTGLDERIRDVRAGPDGFIYMLTDSYDGRLLRLEPVD